MIIFQNDGTIDPRCITITGLNVKPDNPHAFGQFGTGLKYAIAVLLRSGCEITIFSGDKLYEFSTEPETIRGKEFQLIRMHTYTTKDSERVHPMHTETLGFTTDLGKHWELWMAHRELWSNCMDENGTVTQRIEDVEWSEVDMTNKTIIVVTGEAFDKVHETSSEFLLSKVNPIYATDEIEIFAGGSSYVYYQGIRVLELPKAGLYTYNILKTIMLSEDRQASNSYQVNRIIAQGFMGWTDEDMAPVESILQQTNTDNYEKTIDWDWATSGYTPSRQFLQTVAQMRRKNTLRTDAAKLSGRGGGWYSADTKLVEAPPTELEASWIAYDKGFVASLGFTRTDELQIHISEDVEISDGLVREYDAFYCHPSFLERGQHRLIRAMIERLLGTEKNLYGDARDAWIMNQWLMSAGLKFKVPESEAQGDDNTTVEDLIEASQAIGGH